MKRQWSTAKAVNDRVRRLALNPPDHKPTNLGKGIGVRISTKCGWPIYYVEPEVASGTRSHVVFLHGGAYIEEIARPHWRFVGELAREAPTRCVVPIFPLAPKATAGAIVPTLGHLLRELIDDVGAENVAVVGNSAGAGLAVAVSQWLRDSAVQQPRIIVLISPWLDVTLSRTEQVAIAAIDPVQDIPGLVQAGRLYAGNLPVSHPFVSPLNGAFHSLAPMLVFSGTLDLLHSDSQALRRKIKEAGARLDLHVKASMPHNYVFLPSPEGRKARALIAKVVGHMGENVDISALGATKNQ